MSAKISAARRQAFLRALVETGNVTLSAERTKVSRSWVRLHRKGDPAFDAACRAAVDEAKASFDRLGMNGSMKPPRGWGHLDGVELVVRGTNGRRVQIARARLSQISPRVEDRFLAALSATCNVQAALAEAGISKGAAYTHRKRWPAFARRWDAAIEEGALRLELALIEYASSPFSRSDPPIPAPTPPPDPHQALHLLHMHKHRLHGLGKRPGLPPRLPGAEEVRGRLLRNIETIKRGRDLSEADRTRDRRDWALRRRSG